MTLSDTMFLNSQEKNKTKQRNSCICTKWQLEKVDIRTCKWKLMWYLVYKANQRLYGQNRSRLAEKYSYRNLSKHDTYSMLFILYICLYSLGTLCVKCKECHTSAKDLNCLSNRQAHSWQWFLSPRKTGNGLFLQPTKRTKPRLPSCKSSPGHFFCPIFPGRRFCRKERVLVG